MASQIRLLKLQILNLTGGVLITSSFVKTEQLPRSAMLPLKELRALAGLLRLLNGLIFFPNPPRPAGAHPATIHSPPSAMDRTTTRVEAAYVAQHAAALATLQALQTIIEDMPAPDAETRINWGHVGSLTEINEQLGQLLRFAIGV
jgi:hypothetical protein